MPTNGLITLSGGNYETATGVIPLALGTNAGQIAIIGGASGFNASTNPLTINFNGGATLLWGTNYFAPTTLVLNNGMTPNETNITVVNAIDLNGATRAINVNASIVTLPNGFTNSLSATGGGLTKIGAGNQVLTGTNIYTGPTAINAGTLTINGQLLNSAVTANSGGALAGTGYIGGPVTINTNATLSPGSGGIGTLTVGTLTLTNGAMLAFDLGATNNSDLVIVTNLLSFTGMQTNWFALNTTGGFGPGTYTLFHDLGGTNISFGAGTNFTGINGTPYNGMLTTQGSDVVLVVIPEPGAGTLVGAGLLAMFLLRRWRRR